MIALGRRRALWLCLAGLTAGCLAPTLPLPPPSDPEISGPDANGQVTVQGYVEPTAIAYVFNQSQNEGRFQQTGANGRYTISLPADVGDQLQVWYSIGGEVSPSLVVQVE
ncbi:MAG: hypothetical protein KF718_22735 [Polyangiaceae bacterium]|nr:hypothetical protein [Polyangiaceae bacterium]